MLTRPATSSPTKELLARHSLACHTKQVFGECDAVDGHGNQETIGERMEPYQIERALLPVPAERKATDDLPAIVADAGPAARFAWEEFLFGRLRNHHTRRAYGRAVRPIPGLV